MSGESFTETKMRETEKITFDLVKYVYINRIFTQVNKDNLRIF